MGKFGCEIEGSQAKPSPGKQIEDKRCRDSREQNSGHTVVEDGLSLTDFLWEKIKERIEGLPRKVQCKNIFCLFVFNYLSSK